MRTYTADEVDAMIGRSLARERERVAQQQEPPTVAELVCVCGAEWEWRNRDWELVATPPAQRTWVNATTWRGLTDEEIDQGLLRSDYAFKTAEAWRAGVVFAMTKLKEKNNA